MLTCQIRRTIRNLRTSLTKSKDVVNKNPVNTESKDVVNKNPVNTESKDVVNKNSVNTESKNSVNTESVNKNHVMVNHGPNDSEPFSQSLAKPTSEYNRAPVEHNATDEKTNNAKNVSTDKTITTIKREQTHNEIINNKQAYEKNTNINKHDSTPDVTSVSVKNAKSVSAKPLDLFKQR